MVSQDTPFSFFINRINKDDQIDSSDLNGINRSNGITLVNRFTCLDKDKIIIHKTLEGKHFHHKFPGRFALDAYTDINSKGYSIAAYQTLGYDIFDEKSDIGVSIAKLSSAEMKNKTLENTIKRAYARASDLIYYENDKKFKPIKSRDLEIKINSEIFNKRRSNYLNFNKLNVEILKGEIKNTKCDFYYSIKDNFLFIVSLITF